MKLIPKLSLFVFILVASTALITIFFSITTIRSINYDLNIQLIEKDLNNIHHFIADKYSALEKHDLHHVKNYYQKAIADTQAALNTTELVHKGYLVILSESGQEIVNSSLDDGKYDKHLMDSKYLVSIQQSMTQTAFSQADFKNGIKISELSHINRVVFYKKIPEWDLGLFIVLKNDELYSRLNDYINNITIKFIIVLFMALLAGFLFSRYLVTRIRVALQQIHHVQKDEMNARIKNIQANDEISELNSGLNHMTEIIADKIRKHTQSEKEVTKSKIALQEQHALLSAFISAMPELAFIFDETGEYIEIFGSNLKLLCAKKEELLGKNLTSFVPELIAKQFMQTIDTTLKTHQPQVLDYNMEINGTNTYFQGHASVLDFEHKTSPHRGLVIWIVHDITEQVQAQKQAYKLSLYDTLTELPNRRFLMERLDQEIARAKRHEQSGALLFIDLDNFKIINDNFGHLIGDLLLIEVAKRLTQQLRKEDIAFRLGGDEFVILLSNLDNNILTASNMAQTIAQKILEIIQETYILRDIKHHISCSIGVVLFPDNECCDSQDVIKYADIAMYKAKDEGKNSVKVYTSHMQALLEKQLQLQNDLRIAIKQSDLTIHLQPQYDQNGLIVSAEALVRWEHPDKGFIPPAEFIAIAEESGLIHALGRSVMIQVLETLQKLLKQKVSSSFKRIAINVSPWQFGQKDFVTEIEVLLEKYQIPASYLDIEITEQTLIGNFSVFAKKMEQMQNMGCYFSIDDFGTGYSSLSYLKSLPVNMLKIDRSFIEELTKNKNNDAIVDTIIVMARHLGLEVLAEGVETKVQLDFLKQHDCHFYQGYYFSKPLVIDDFINLLSN